MVAAQAESPSSLPAPLTPLVGRTREIAAVTRLLCDPVVRLVTLTGPGGVGKTRLAVQMATMLRDASAFADGVVFVPLAALRDAANVVPAIAQALDVREGGERPLLERLKRVLSPRDLLIVIDNLEHVLTCAPLLTELLTACPGLTLLTTSRERLYVHGEHEYPIPPLSLPDPRRLPVLAELSKYEAIALFMQRAGAVSPGFGLTAENAPAVAQICARLDGLPLAIELAAARIKLLPPHGLLARLDHRLALLTGGARDLPERQQTLRGTIAWSYDLLAPAEQRLFRRLAIFPAGCTLEAAERVAADGLEVDVLARLGSLLDKSLLVRSDDPSGVARFKMLETVREFAAEQLESSGEEDAARERLVVWAVDFVDRSVPEGGDFPISLTHRGQLAQVEPELDNLLAAIVWGIDRDAIRRVVTVLGSHYFHRGYTAVGTEAVELALAHSAGASPEMRLRLLTALGWLRIVRRDLDGAQACAEESLQIARSTGNPHYLGEALFMMGDFAQARGELDRAERLLGEAVGWLRQSHHQVRLCHAQMILGLVTYRRGDLERASALFETAIATSEDIGSTWSAAAATLFYARVIRERGAPARAAQMWIDSARHLLDHGDRMTASYSLRPLAGLAATYGQPCTATNILGAYSALDDVIGVPLSTHGQAAYERLLAELRSRLRPDEFDAAWSVGRDLTLEQAIQLAETISIPPDGAFRHTRSRISDAPYGLSAREVEVLRLLVEGRSSQEIAEALFISPRTVRTHVTNIFNKLNVSSRAAAVGVALRQGIV